MSSKLLIEKTSLVHKYAIVEEKILKYIRVMVLDKPRVDEIYLGKVEKYNKTMGSAFVNIGDHTVFLMSDQSLAEGETRLVQITREAEKTKLARASLDITIGGEYAVLILNSDTIKASKKTRGNPGTIELMEELAKIHDASYGILLRSKADIGNIELVKEEIEKNSALLKSLKSDGLGLKYSSFDENEYIQNLASSYRVSKIISNHDETIKEIKKLRMTDISLDYDPIFLFNRNSINMETFLNPTFESEGVSLTINFLEALCIIDVDSGHISSDSIKKIKFKSINERAFIKALEVIELMEISGIIVIDLISMDKETTKDFDKFVSQNLKKFLKNLKVVAYPTSGAGLLQLILEKRESGLVPEISRICDKCHGSGLVLSADMTSDAFEIELLSKIKHSNNHDFVVTIPRDLEKDKRETMMQICQLHGATCSFKECCTNKIRIE